MKTAAKNEVLHITVDFLFHIPKTEQRMKARRIWLIGMDNFLNLCALVFIMSLRWAVFPQLRSPRETFSGVVKIPCVHVCMGNLNMVNLIDFVIRYSL